MFEVADKNKDGSVTFDEFINFLCNEAKKDRAETKDNAHNKIKDPMAGMMTGNEYVQCEMR